MKAFLSKSNNYGERHGKQSLKSLTKRGATIENVEISGDNIASFKKVARKYNISFALKKDTSVAPPNWIVFFKSKDSKALDIAFKEYYKDVLKYKTPKPSMEQQLNKNKEKTKDIAIETAHKATEIIPMISKKGKSRGDMEL